MPWCDTCSKFWTPTSVPADGTCPKCGRNLARTDGPISPAEPVTSKNLDLKKLAGKEAKAPWHFKLLMVALIAYLTWRVIQLGMLIF
jgi:hypothetical protein